MTHAQQVVSRKELVAHLLRNPHATKWTMQGLGMLRTYLDEARAIRLHVWHETARADGVSEMHTHPWSFTSYVVAGAVNNTRFIEAEGPNSSWFSRQTIRCGVGGGLVGESEPVSLVKLPLEHYGEGSCYSQHASEIHLSSPVDGTVTVIRRQFGQDTEHAYVYWAGEEWVTAEPRTATEEEVDQITRYALDRWF